MDWSWRSGAAGERMVGRTLRYARLFGWRSLHAVPVGSGKSDIDHVLIGPGGVITINTKHHRRQKIKAGHTCVLVGGSKTNYARDSTFEGERAAKLLSAAAGRPVNVTPVLVIVGAKRIRGSRTAGVELFTRSHLLVWLLMMPRKISNGERDRLFEIARRSDTWQTTPVRRRRSR